MSRNLPQNRGMPTKREPLDPEEDRLWRALMRLVVILPRALSDLHERTVGLNGTEYHVLLHLSEADGHRLRMSEIAERTALSAALMTRAVGELGNRGFVTKERDAEDGRAVVVTLTKSGANLVRRAYPHLLAYVRGNVLDSLGPDEVAQVGKALRRVVDDLEA
jgi:DNA-binding MarR family transcriptional regulator